MKSSLPPNDPLEQLIAKTLREQPPRRAPTSMESQVLAAIAQRSARSWWRKDFGRWPLAARATFVVLCVVLGKFAIDASMWLMAGADPASVASELVSLVVWMKMLVIGATSLVRTIPSAWVYAGAMIVGAMYALLFGLSAVAYRTLYENR